MMKAVLLCAGEGTRLRPLTFARPKHLVPVAGRPVLDHVMDSLVDAGVREVVFVVAPHAPALREYIGDGGQWGVTVEFAVQDAPRGLADAVRCAREYVAGERFIVYLGDDLLGDGVAQFVSGFAASDAQASLVVKPVDNPRAFGVVVVEEGRVTRLVEKPPDPPGNLAIVGIYGFGPEIFDSISSIRPSARGELEITDAIEDLLERGGHVECHVTDGFWADAGSPEALLSANEYFIERDGANIRGVTVDCEVEGAVRVEPGASVSGSTLRGPCLVCAGAVVEDSELGPNVTVGADSRVRRSRLVNTILDEDCTIEGAAAGLVDSVLGREAQVFFPAAAQERLSILAGDRAVITAPAEQ